MADLSSLRSKGLTEADVLTPEAISFFEQFGPASSSILDAWFEEVGHSLTQSFIDLGAAESDLALLEFLQVPGPEITAGCETYSDGSSLIRMYDGMIALTVLYTSHLALTYVKEGIWATLREAAHRARGLPGTDDELLVAALRYAALNQRMGFRLLVPYLKLDDRPMEHAEALQTHTLRFIIAHELAHLTLGHSRLSGGGSCHSDPAREARADQLAVQAVLKTHEREGSGPATYAALGALVAVVAISFSEQALLLRRGGTHPPALERLEYLLSAMPPRLSAQTKIFGFHLVHLTGRASDFSLNSPRIPWELAIDHPLTGWQPGDDAARRQLATAAEILATSPDEQIQYLREEDTRCGTRLTAGAEAVLDDRIHEGLRLWGVKERELGAITDPFIALSFSGLLKQIQNGLGLSGLQADLRATTLVAQRLTRLENSA
ncbi:phage exclusion protein Lit family protein [Streptomyces sp. NPDC006992]|uniref:phage exclusion protein Lit family protein n=1 Tax=Streptomyces sp. NPDC006992 TaxID=3155601 RepID=UPI0033EA59BC